MAKALTENREEKKGRRGDPVDSISHGKLVYPGGALRLYVTSDLHAGAQVAPDAAQNHYLLHVMRAKEGSTLRLFNGRDGEWLASLAEVSKRTCMLACMRKIAPQREAPDLWFAFAPIKKTPGDYVVQKATELGVRRILPVFTRRSIVARVNLARLRANAVEAAEQSGRLTVPEISAPQTLRGLLEEWPRTRRLLFCDEAGDAPAITAALQASPEGSWGVLTGPEGGFAPEERSLLRSMPFVVPAALGRRILRADTAALAALAVWQALKGDWSADLAAGPAQDYIPED